MVIEPHVLGVDFSTWNEDPLPFAAWFARGVRVAVGRITIGDQKDSDYPRHLQEAAAAGIPVRGGYAAILHYGTNPARGPAAQCRKFISLIIPGLIHFAALDIEAAGVTEAHIREWLQEWFNHPPTIPLLLYGNKGLETLVGANDPYFADFGTWVADYGFNDPATGHPPIRSEPPADARLPRIPAVGKFRGWQFAGENGRLAPYTKAIDLTHWVGTLADLMREFNVPGAESLPQPPPPTGGNMKPGTMYGIHAQSTSSAVPLMQKYQAAGVQVAVVIGVENPGLCTDAKRINQNILTIARWLNPNNKWERGHDVFNWSQNEREDFAIKGIQMIFDRTNDEEYTSCDYFCPGINEPDPPEPDGAGYKALAEVMILLCNEATRRSPEMVARGFHPIRLAIPGFNAGTPEWDEVRAMRDTGLFELMKQRGDILMFHEGVWWDMPIDAGFGDSIPGAPMVPPNAGSLCGRFNYWYGGLGVDVPFVVTEWYDGGTKNTDPLTRLAAMKWYDRMARHNKYFLGFCPFELTDDPNGEWSLVDFTLTFKSDAMLADMIAQKNVPNPLIDPEDDMDETTRLKLIGNMDAAAVQIAAAKSALVALAPPTNKHTMANLTNQQVINLFNTLFGGLQKLESVLTPAQRVVLYTRDTSGNRSAHYTGPAVEDMALTEAEKQRVIAAL